MGIIITSLFQRINLLNRTVLLTLGGACALVAAVIWGFSQMDSETMNRWSTTVANILLMTIITGFIVAGVRKKVNVYDAFIEGAKEGFTTAVRIIPYLVAILVGIGVFRASGAMDMLIGGLRAGVDACGVDAQWVDAMPTALMKPLSGSGARSKALQIRLSTSLPFTSVRWASRRRVMLLPVACWQTWQVSWRLSPFVICSLRDNFLCNSVIIRTFAPDFRNY